MGLRDWRYLDALAELQAAGPLPVRMRVYLASGLAAEASPAELGRRRARYDGPWVRLDGVKFYADGWLGPRTCAVCRDVSPMPGSGGRVLFLDGPALAPPDRAADRGGLGGSATHAIGDRAVGGGAGRLTSWPGPATGPRWAAAAPRIEHGQPAVGPSSSRGWPSWGVDGLHPAVVRGHRRRAGRPGARPGPPGPGPTRGRRWPRPAAGHPGRIRLPDRDARPAGRAGPAGPGPVRPRRVRHAGHRPGAVTTQHGGRAGRHVRCGVRDDQAQRRSAEPGPGPDRHALGARDATESRFGARNPRAAYGTDHCWLAPPLQVQSSSGCRSRC